MATGKLVKCQEGLKDYDHFEIGGKGLNLLRLYHASHKIKTFNVPDFFIIPGDYYDCSYLFV